MSFRSSISRTPGWYAVIVAGKAHPQHMLVGSQFGGPLPTAERAREKWPDALAIVEASDLREWRYTKQGIGPFLGLSPAPRGPGSE